MPMTELFTLGRDAEVRTTPSGMAVTNLSLAFTYGRKDDTTGKKPTQWVDAALWGKRAEQMAPYLLKGTKLMATLEEVHIQTFTKADQTVAHKMAGTVLHLTLAGSPQQASAPAPAPALRLVPAPRPAPTKTGFDDMDDDIPFIVSLLEYEVAPSKARRLSHCDFK